jgi:hypothetical protein
MASTDPSLTTHFPDRSERLVVAGMIEVLLGSLFFLLVASMSVVLGSHAGVKGPEPAESTPTVLIHALVTDVLISVVFIWVGIGLCRARRWAWALTVAWSWVWIVMGVVSFTYVILGLPAISAAARDGAKATAGSEMLLWAVPIVTFVLMFFAIPGTLLALCHHESVRATCERRDPKTRWTDRCPLPVLAVSLLLTFSISSTFSTGGCLPVFGFYISGVAGVIVAALIAGLLAVLAWGIYRLRPAAWWGAAVAAVVVTADSVFMFAAMDLSDMYRRMGTSAELIEQMQKAGMFQMFSRYGPWLSLATGIGALGYLMFLRRYFFGARILAPSAQLN